MRRLFMLVLAVAAVMAAVLAAAGPAATAKPRSGLKVSLSVSPGSLHVLRLTVVKTNSRPMSRPYWIHVRTIRSTSPIYPVGKEPRGMVWEPYSGGVLIRLPKLAYRQRVSFSVIYARKDLVLGKYERPRVISYMGNIIEQNQPLVFKEVKL